jgi:hypothetical protein
MYSQMKRFILIVLMLLTVFRALAGSAMAMEMDVRTSDSNAAQAAGYSVHDITKNVTAYTEKMVASNNLALKSASSKPSKPPCHGQEETTQAEATQPTKCTACQVCHMTSFIPGTFKAVLVNLDSEAPLQIASHWHSAERAASFKPPVI